MAEIVLRTPFAYSEKQWTKLILELRRIYIKGSLIEQKRIDDLLEYSNKDSVRFEEEIKLEVKVGELNLLTGRKVTFIGESEQGLYAIRKSLELINWK